MRYFPLFADLHGRRVLVVGGGAVAERKVRLLLDAGAQVRLVAPAVTAWLGEHPAVEVHRVAFAPEYFDGAVLAIAATDNLAVNAAVAAAGRERNVLVNVVDVSELSSFIVPAIVDRSPLVIAISTGGVAPVLARLVRERLESLIDGSFGQLAGLLQHWRGRIKGGLPTSIHAAAFTRRWCVDRSRRWCATTTCRAPSASWSARCSTPMRRGAAASCSSAQVPAMPAC